MKLQRWINNNTGKLNKGRTGGRDMENVIALDNYKNEVRLESEWDIIGNIFAKAINKSKLTQKQAIKMIEDIKQEVRNK